MNLVTSFSVAVLLLSGLSLQDLLDGSCSQFPVSNVRPFSQISLFGYWYLYRTLDAGQPLHDNDCITFFYQIGPDGILITTERSKNLATNKRVDGQSFAIFNRPYEGYYIYEIPAAGVSQPTQIICAGPLYFVEFNCTDRDGKADCYVGVFTRSAYPDTITLDEIQKCLYRNGLDRLNLRNVYHGTKCYL